MNTIVTTTSVSVNIFHHGPSKLAAFPYNYSRYIFPEFREASSKFGQGSKIMLKGYSEKIKAKVGELENERCSQT